MATKTFCEIVLTDDVVIPKGTKLYAETNGDDYTAEVIVDGNAAIAVRED